MDVSTGEEAYPCRFRSGEALSRAIEAGVSDPDLLWKAAAQAGENQGLSVTWYPECEGLMRRYGTGRMLLVKDGKSGLFSLDGTQYIGFVFDAVGEVGAVICWQLTTRAGPRRREMEHGARST